MCPHMTQYITTQSMNYYTITISAQITYELFSSYFYRPHQEPDVITAGNLSVIVSHTEGRLVPTV